LKTFNTQKTLRYVGFFVYSIHYRIAVTMMANEGVLFVSNTENLHQGHRARVKKAYIQHGIDHFEDHQVLELLLFYCYPRKDTKIIARQLINAFGSLHNLMEANPKDIMEKCGVSENVAVLISLTPHLAQRYLKSRWKEKTILNNAEKVGNYAKSIFVGKKYECFYLICLNTQHGLLGSEMVHEGTIDSVAIFPRNLVEICLRYNATYAILAHNHPGGSLIPSKEDVKVTEDIKKALKLIDIEVLDHIIVAGEEYFSFSKGGLL